MKLLLDACVWGGAKVQLQSAGHDVIWAGDWPNDPGDSEILAYAFEEMRCLITLDKDFGELAVFFGAPHRGIIRLVDVAAQKHAEVSLRVIEKFEHELSRNPIITVEANRVRIRVVE